MKLHLACSGGLTNLRLAGEIDTAELPAELARQVVAAMQPRKLQRASTAARDPQMTDAQQYELTLLSSKSGEQATSFRLDEASQIGDELLEALDALRQELLERKIAARD